MSYNVYDAWADLSSGPQYLVRAACATDALVGSCLSEWALEASAYCLDATPFVPAGSTKCGLVCSDGKVIPTSPTVLR